MATHYLKHKLHVCACYCRSAVEKGQAEVEKPAEEAEVEAVGLEGLAALEASLRPVEKYAVRCVEQVKTFLPVLSDATSRVLGKVFKFFCS